MARFIERVAVEWYEIQAGRIRVRQGHPSHLKIQALRRLFESAKMPAVTSVWTTRDRCIHFRLNFPRELRDEVRRILDP